LVSILEIIVESVIPLSHLSSTNSFPYLMWNKVLVFATLQLHSTETYSYTIEVNCDYPLETNANLILVSMAMKLVSVYEADAAQELVVVEMEVELYLNERM
jgi:hypothetical protein